jgi:hypothetical protein
MKVFSYNISLYPKIFPVNYPTDAYTNNICSPIHHIRIPIGNKALMPFIRGPVKNAKKYSPEKVIPPKMFSGPFAKCPKSQYG